MNDSLKNKIFSSSECISEQMMFAYIDKKLNNSDQHIVEKHLLDCEFCSEAMDGLELLSDRTIIKSVNDKVNKIAKKEKEAKIIFFNFKTISSIAAALLLLIGAIFFFKYSFNNKEDAIAEFKQEKNINDETLKTTPSPLEEISASKIDESNYDTIDSKNINNYSLNDSKKNQKSVAHLKTKQDSNKPINIDYNLLEDAIENKNQQTPVASTSVSNFNNSTNTISKEIITKNEGKKKDLSDDNNSKLITSEIGAQTESEKFTSGNFERDKKNEEKATKTDDTKTQESITRNDKPLENEKTVESQTISKSKNKKANTVKPKKQSISEYRDNEKKSKEQLAISSDSDIILADEEPALADPKKSEASQKSITEEISYFEVDEKPTFPGGEKELLKYFNSNLLTEKNQTLADSIQNTKTVYVQFIINKEGKAINPKIMKLENHELEKKLIELVNNMPLWTPGKLNKKVVNVKYTLPIQVETK